MKRLKILFVSSRLPYPLIGGDRIKSYNLLSHLAKHHDVTLVSFFQGKWDNSYEAELQSLGLNTRVIKINPIKAGYRTFKNFKSKFPLEILYYFQPEMQSIVDEELNSGTYDLAIGFFMRTAEYLKDKNIPKILIAEDCRALYQYRSFRNTTDFWQKLVRKKEYIKLANYEPITLSKFDKVTFVTSEDINGIRNISKFDTDLALLTNGTDVIDYEPNLDFSTRKYVLFIGKLDLWSNVLMLRRIVKKILPEIWKKYPDLKLRIVGGFPIWEIRRYASHPNIELIINSKDIVKEYLGARLFIHPHYGSSGIQNKLLEAMGTECPVVTSQSGNQGIYGIDGQDLLLADTDQEFIAQSLRLLDDSNFSEKLGKSARELIVRTHSWQSIFAECDKLIEKVVG